MRCKMGLFGIIHILPEKTLIQIFAAVAYIWRVKSVHANFLYKI